MKSIDSAAAVPTFNALNMMLVEFAGTAIFMPNYRGSIGYSKEYIEELQGFIGIKDVEDCENATNSLIVGI